VLCGCLGDTAKCYGPQSERKPKYRVIRLPPVDLITERVLQLRALAESSDVQSARAALRRYFKGGEITLTPGWPSKRRSWSGVTGH
jgi:hypothetical protein